MSQRRPLAGPRARRLVSPSAALRPPSARRSSCLRCAPQDDILNLFYDEYVHKLAGPIAGGAKQLHVGTGPINGEAAAGAAAADGGAAAAAAAGGGSNGELDDLPDLGFENVLSTQQHVCELLCFCVQARAPTRLATPRHATPRHATPQPRRCRCGCRLPPRRCRGFR